MLSFPHVFNGTSNYFLISVIEDHLFLTIHNVQATSRPKSMQGPCRKACPTKYEEKTTQQEYYMHNVSSPKIETNYVQIHNQQKLPKQSKQVLHHVCTHTHPSTETLMLGP